MPQSSCKTPTISFTLNIISGINLVEFLYKINNYLNVEQFYILISVNCNLCISSAQSYPVSQIKYMNIPYITVFCHSLFACRVEKESKKAGETRLDAVYATNSGLSQCSLQGVSLFCKPQKKLLSTHTKMFMIL